LLLALDSLPTPGIRCGFTSVPSPGTVGRSGPSQRHHPMPGFRSFASASRSRVALALHMYFRLRLRCGEQASLGAQRQKLAERCQTLVAEVASG